MKQKFTDINFTARSLALIDQANEIIDAYLAQNLRLTLRQLYYQLVTRNIIPNQERAYKNLSSLVSDGRLAGLIDWNAIEDRLRRPVVPNEFADLNQLVDAALMSYRLPRWDAQPQYIELWVEKDALAGVLQPLAQEYHVTLMVNRGYSSQSAMRESALRFHARAGKGKECHLFYLGDLDPSGEDMVRDIDSRLKVFRQHLGVHKLALLMDQVEQYALPPNPAKMSDPRAAGFVEVHGYNSWEVDALRPEVLQGLIRQGLDAHVDEALMETVKAQEESDKEMLREALSHLGNGRQ